MNIYTRFKKNTLIYLGILLLIIFAVIIYSGIKNMDIATQTHQGRILPHEETASISPSEATTTGDPQQVLLEKIANRPKLSPEDDAAKQKMIALLPPNQNSGVIIESDTVKVEYVQSPDIFQVEILTTDITQAKINANSIFRKFGMSQKGICYLPLQFYLNYDVARQLGEQKKSFNPLPIGC
jgi:hypothetical protein